jgi:Fe-S cluster biogenesis protein NfuA
VDKGIQQNLPQGIFRIIPAICPDKAMEAGLVSIVEIDQAIGGVKLSEQGACQFFPVFKTVF